MRLLWINHYAITPAEGGGTRHYELGRELAHRGWDVDIAATDFNLQARRYTRRRSTEEKSPIVEIRDGVRFVWCWSAPYTRNDWRRAWNWITFARAVLSAPVTEARVVIGSSPHLFAALAGWVLAARWNVPFVLEVRDLWPESIVAAGGRKGPVYFALSALARFLYSRADRIIVLARGSGEHLVNAGISRSKIDYVPNGVDPGAFPALHLPSHDGPLTFVYAGAHGPANGLDAVIDAADLLRERKDIRFLLVGDGPAKASLEMEAERRGLKNVEFKAPVRKADMPAVLGTAHAGLMVLRESPLFAYGVSPNKLFDYLAAGLPVICNVPGEVASMLEESGAGIQARSGSGEDLAKAIMALRELPQESVDSMRTSGREWVIREHGRPVLAERLERILRQIAR